MKWSFSALLLILAVIINIPGSIRSETTGQLKLARSSSFSERNNDDVDIRSNIPVPSTPSLRTILQRRVSFKNPVILEGPSTQTVTKPKSIMKQKKTVDNNVKFNKKSPKKSAERQLTLEELENRHKRIQGPIGKEEATRNLYRDFRKFMKLYEEDEKVKH